MAFFHVVHTQYEHPATVLLSILWGLAAVLAAAAFAVSVRGTSAASPTAAALRATGSSTGPMNGAESAGRSSMLRAPRRTTGHQKLG